MSIPLLLIYNFTKIALLGLTHFFGTVSIYLKRGEVAHNYFYSLVHISKECCTNAICCVAFGIQAWSRTLVRSLRLHPQRLASHPSCNILIK